MNKEKMANIAKRVFDNRWVILGTWVILAVFTTIKQFHQGSEHNNYRIFINTFFHAKAELNLFLRYPLEYDDMNHYGPVFALVIAPFALLPKYYGMFFWQITNVLLLYLAVSKLPLKKSNINAVYWIVANELLSSLFSFQINPAITAIIILSYTSIEKQKNFLATFLILLGTFIKLYGIVGLAFFFFVKNKKQFIAYCFFWSILLFILPMPFFGSGYVIDSYKDWYYSLSAKQLENATLVSWQDISVMGIVRRISQNSSIPNWPFLLAGIVLFCLPYLRIKQYKHAYFRLMYLASTLIFAIIFSNSSESPTYIIAFTGIAIWFIIQDRPFAAEVIALFVFAVILTTLAPTDFIPKYIRINYIMKYSLKALPCAFVWLYLTWQMLFQDFGKNLEQPNKGAIV